MTILFVSNSALCTRSPMVPGRLTRTMCMHHNIDPNRIDIRKRPTIGCSQHPKTVCGFEPEGSLTKAVFIS